MKKRYKIVLNVEITDPEKPFPGGGDFNHSTRIEGVVKLLTRFMSWPDGVTVTLDKMIDKGEMRNENK